MSVGTWAFGATADEPTDFETALTRIHELGFDGVDFGALDPHPTPGTHSTARERAELGGMIRQRAGRIAAVAADFGGTSFLRAEDPADYVDAFRRNVRFCTEIGADRLAVNTLDPPELVAAVGYKSARHRLREAWNRCLDYAAHAGVAVVWEPEPAFAFNEPSQIGDVVADLGGHANFGLLYDTAHAYMICEVGARHERPRQTLPNGQLDLIAEVGGLIRHVHILDADGSVYPEAGPLRTTRHVPIGEGTLDFDPLVEALLGATQGATWWCIDLCFCPDPWGEIRQQKLLVDGLLAKHASGVIPTQ